MNKGFSYTDDIKSPWVHRDDKHSHFSENSMRHRLEIVTNIIVLAVTLLVGFRFVEGIFFPRERTLKAGQKIPEISGYSWNKTPTLVLALRKGCHYCEESMPFYRRLLAMQQAGQLNARLVALFPDDSTDVTELMESQKLAIPAFPAIHLDAFRVSGTPTLILVDQNGRVVKPWIGRQDVAGENDVIRTIGQLPAAKLCMPPSPLSVTSTYLALIGASHSFLAWNPM
jgi:hypothetical protein